MKFKFNKISIDNVEANIKTKVSKMLSDPALLNEVGDTVIRDIQYQTRRGVSAVTGERFKPTKRSWREKREKIAEATPTHETYGKNRSNLTLTGQLLDSLRKVISGKGIKIYFAGFHMPYRQKYMEYFTRKKKKRRINLGKTVKGFETSAGGISYVNTGNSGTYQVGKVISNEKLSKYVEENGRPFFGIRDKLMSQLKSIVIRYIRRKL